MTRSCAMTWAAGLLMATALLLGGCTALQGPARIDNPSAALPKSFPGLIAPDSGAERRYIFQVHGINADPTDAWAQQLFDALMDQKYTRVGDGSYGYRCAMFKIPETASGIGLAAATSAGTCLDPASGKTIADSCVKERCDFDHFGRYRKDIYANPAGRQVIVFTYRWRDDVWLINDQFISPDMKDNSLPGWTLSTRRSKLNAFIKSSVMDNGISDAAAYASPLRDLEREGLESALCAMYQDAIDPAKPAPQGLDCLKAMADAPIDESKVEFNFLSHSLGSRMLFDVLSAEAAPSERSARKIIVNQMRTFFMAANQLPLLATVDLTVKRVDQGPPEPPHSFLTYRRPTTAAAAAPVVPVPAPAPGAAPELLAPAPPALKGVRRNSPVTAPLTIVAFQDPDDLLGYRGSDGVLKDAPMGVTFVDVIHRNAPQILWVVDWIATAHDNEMKEPNSRQIIMCGGTMPDGVHVKAASC